MWILLFVAVGYFGSEVLSVYLPYWRFKDAMNTEAQFAPSVNDATIRRRLIRHAEDLGLPQEARRIVIRRTARPREITIFTEYQQMLELPFFRRMVTLRPFIRKQL